MSGSSSLPHLKTTLAIVLIQPDTKYNVDIGNLIKDSLCLSPTGDVLNKVEVKLGKNRNGTLSGDRKLLLLHRQVSPQSQKKKPFSGEAELLVLYHDSLNFS